MFYTLPNFLLYIITVIPLYVAIVWTYTKITPYNEFELIEKGNMAAVLSLLGTAVGIALPIASVVSHSGTILDVLGWSLVALTVQLLVWWAVSKWIIPGVCKRVPNGDVAAGTTLGGVSLVAGILNAACLTY